MIENWGENERTVESLQNYYQNLSAPWSNFQNHPSCGIFKGFGYKFGYLSERKVNIMEQGAPKKMPRTLLIRNALH